MLENLENGEQGTDPAHVQSHDVPVTGVIYDQTTTVRPSLEPPLLGNMSTVGNDPPNLHIRSSPDSENTGVIWNVKVKRDG